MSNSTNSSKNVKLIIIAVLAPLLVIGGGFGIFALLNQKLQNAEVSRSKNQTGKVSEIFNSPNIEKKTFKSKISSISFDYPSDWMLSETSEKNENVDQAKTILQKNGKTIELNEVKMLGGLGGRCDENQKGTILRAEKLAGIQPTGSWSVMEYRYTGKSEKALKVIDRNRSGDYDCENGGFGWEYPIGQYAFEQGGFTGSNNLVGLEFKFVGDSSKLSAEEKKEIVEILSSLKF
jgi:hypothetical protein